MKKLGESLSDKELEDMRKQADIYLTTTEI